MQKAGLSILAACAILFLGDFSAAKPEQAYLAQRVLPDTWVSPYEHYFAAAGCYPHCASNQADPMFFQEPYPDNIDVTKVGFICHGNGRADDPCALDGMSYSVDTADKGRRIINATWTNRSDEVWVRLAAPVKKTK